MISNIGCKPYWLDHIPTDKVDCSKASQLDKFLEYNLDLNTISTEEELTEKYNCLKPCEYMEYKVDTPSQKIISQYFGHFNGHTIIICLTIGT